MRVMIAGQKWFAVEVFRLCLRLGYEVAAVAVPDAGDRLASAASEAGMEIVIAPARLAADDVPPGTDLIIGAHCHCFVSASARGAARLGAIGYHPSLLPRHRGADAIRWAIHMREPITGGTVYWMTCGADTGPIAAQDWCHIWPDDTPAELWKRELAPMGLRLVERVLKNLEEGMITAVPQDEKLATWEPAFERRKLDAM